MILLREGDYIEKYWLWLISIEDMYNDKIKRIMSVFNNPRELFFASENMLKKSKVINDKELSKIILSRKVYSYDKFKESLDKKKIKFITMNSKDYPENLKKIYDPPYGLFIKGNTIPNNPSVAIVGARNCTLYGKGIAEKIAELFSINGIDVISGMARGIDTSAHKGALKQGGRTFAVLGCGVDICYPRENINIFSEIQKKGCIISEYPPGKDPLKWHFPARNRIISGLADVIILVEAKERSGSLITVECALEQGKDVYAVPGRLDDELSKGCNELIKSGADIFTCTEEVVELLNTRYGLTNKILQKEKYSIAKEYEVVYSGLDLYPKNVDTIIEETGLKSEEILRILLQLQLLNLVDEPIKGYYSRRD